MAVKEVKAIKIFEINSDKWPNGEIISFITQRVKMSKGEFIQINLKDGAKTAVIACPKCGVTRPLRTHKLVLENGGYSVYPSIDNTNGCCDYHGFLKGGTFTGL